MNIIRERERERKKVYGHGRDENSMEIMKMGQTSKKERKNFLPFLSRNCVYV